jgi:hypothetical protein
MKNIVAPVILSKSLDRAFIEGQLQEIANEIQMSIANVNKAMGAQVAYQHMLNELDAQQEESKEPAADSPPQE